jgi:hypothetical protein
MASCIKAQKRGFSGDFCDLAAKYNEQRGGGRASSSHPAAVAHLRLHSCLPVSPSRAAAAAVSNRRTVGQGARAALARRECCRQQTGRKLFEVTLNSCYCQNAMIML